MKTAFTPLGWPAAALAVAAGGADREGCAAPPLRPPLARRIRLVDESAGEAALAALRL